MDPRHMSNPKCTAHFFPYPFTYVDSNSLPYMSISWGQQHLIRMQWVSAPSVSLGTIDNGKLSYIDAVEIMLLYLMFGSCRTGGRTSKSLSVLLNSHTEKVCSSLHTTQKKETIKSVTVNRGHRYINLVMYSCLMSQLSSSTF